MEKSIWWVNCPYLSKAVWKMGIAFRTIDSWQPRKLFNPWIPTPYCSFKYHCMLHHNFKCSYPSQKQQHREDKHRWCICLLPGISVRPSSCSTLSPEACHSAGHYPSPPHQSNIAPQICYSHPSQQTSCILAKGPNTSLLYISLPTWGCHFVQCLPSRVNGKRHRKHPSSPFTLFQYREILSGRDLSLKAPFSTLNLVFANEHHSHYTYPLFIFTRKVNPS